MDIVLRENDIKRMLADALGVSIPSEKMIVSENPLSITIANAEMYLKKASAPLPRKAPEAPAQQPEDTDTPEELPSADDSSLLTMDDLRKQSEGLADIPPQTGSRHTQRTLSSHERTEVPPPTANGKEQ